MTRRHLLFAVILIEGYVTLAVELLVMRQLIPHVGSATDTIAIIISAVLLPLALGYHYGGRRDVQNLPPGRQGHTRGVLLANLTRALLILVPGLSYPLLEVFFSLMKSMGIQGRVSLTTIYCLIFVAYPIFLLGQTVPLASRYFSRRLMAEITGRMLFFSTVGSFLGSVASTLVLMTWLGVHNTVIVTLGMLCLLIVMLARRRLSFEHFFACACLAMAWLLNGNATMKSFHIVADTPYSTITVKEIEKENARVLSINKSASSKLAEDMEKHGFPYVNFIEKTVLTPLMEGKAPCGSACRVLIVGAGGFVMGLHDTASNYTYVDIDGALKAVAEEHFLKQKLGPNKRFVPEPAEYFLRHDTQSYDVIVLDAYSNARTIPPSLITRDYFLLVKARLKEGGVLAVNTILSPSFADRFSVRLDNTLRGVFPMLTRQVIQSYTIWEEQGQPYRNVVYLFRNTPQMQDRGVYTDDRNTYFLDR